MPASSAQNIRFDGDWTPTERRLVESAIADAEGLGASNRAEPSGGPSRSWLCYCKRLDRMTVYMAHRAGWRRVLCASAPHALGLRIILFSQEARGDGGGPSA